MSNIILERYYLGAIILVLIVFLINFISAANICMKDKSIKKYFKIELYFVILIISVASIWYQSAKEELIDKFNSNNNILCRHKSELIVLNKDRNYIFKDGYFLKESVAIDIDGCKSLKE